MKNKHNFLLGNKIDRKRYFTAMVFDNSTDLWRICTFFTVYVRNFIAFARFFFISALANRMLKWWCMDHFIREI